MWPPAKPLGLLALGTAVTASVAALNTGSHPPSITEAAKMAAQVAPADAPRPRPGLPALSVGVGDKVRLAFFERLEAEEDKWRSRRNPRPTTSFFLRQEISGDYTVQAEGHISLPLLGAMQVAGRDVAELTRDLEAVFTAFFERPGFVNITLVERSPVYVVGPVRQAGVYKYEPGLTAMHAVALAGGFDRVQGWNTVEMARESVKLRTSAKRLRRLLAQAAVLRAERDETEAAVPERLVELAGAAAAAALLAEEQERRKATVRAREERRKALATATQAAQQFLTITRGRLGHLQTNLSMRQERMNRLSSLKGVVDRAVIAQAQSDLSDVQERNSDTLGLITNAEQRLTLAKQEEARFTLDVRVELDREIAAVEREIDDDSANLSAGASVLGILGPFGAAGGGNAGETAGFEIIRQTGNGAEVIRADSTTPLRPGDLVRVLAEREHGG